MVVLSIFAYLLQVFAEQHRFLISMLLAQAENLHTDTKTDS